MHFFFFTHDKKYLIKTVTKPEGDFLLSILKNYVQHNKKYKKKTFLNQFYGFYSIKMYNNTLYIIVIKNLFPNKMSMNEIYDLKGLKY